MTAWKGTTYSVPVSAELLEDGQIGRRALAHLATSFFRYAAGHCASMRFGYWCQMGGGHTTAHVNAMGRWWIDEPTNDTDDDDWSWQ